MWGEAASLNYLCVKEENGREGVIGIWWKIFEVGRVQLISISLC